MAMVATMVMPRSMMKVMVVMVMVVTIRIYVCASSSSCRSPAANVCCRGFAPGPYGSASALVSVDGDEVLALP